MKNLVKTGSKNQLFTNTYSLQNAACVIILYHRVDRRRISCIKIFCVSFQSLRNPKMHLIFFKEFHVKHANS